jgi:hypothetical protein
MMTPRSHTAPQGHGHIHARRDWGQMPDVVGDPRGVGADDEALNADQPPGARLTFHDGLPQFVRGRPANAGFSTVLTGAVALPGFGRNVV